ncbi:albusnodin family lasso peptide [Actinoalloteichus fjordicus]|uniref:Uncharacterized protein n=1 Tax=Actinoalloteichus fjordicus TaxID=1612552 RepID=A0AAC9LDE8_9PSEU|nr:albusnodin family lasso peptide [Actinoalloteichus fjordicus]APU15586.1 hypothetical protein UA74_17790 [Actinoalloteichus fjordicus]
MLTQFTQPDEDPTQQPNEHSTEQDPPVLLVSMGEASAVTLGQGKGSSEDKRRAYN